MEKLQTLFRNGSIAVAVTAATAVPAFAAGESIIDTAAIGAKMTQASTDGGTVAGYIALALSVLACAGVVFGMLRKA
ncbi:capsid protein [Pseudomonas citronellolis]|uniref:capsid protein n=1 Tax=Pseudomonas citronellolis TaxID=53408 RepID=UPI0022BA3C51|nr:capsid protein [Pseudomonas citronellolis]